MYMYNCYYGDYLTEWTLGCNFKVFENKLDLMIDQTNSHSAGFEE